MMRVTTQAIKAPVQLSEQKIAEMINNLTCDLVAHARDHSAMDIFNPSCSECLYWAAKVVQNPELWQGYYAIQQVKNLRPLPLEVINAAVEKVATSDNTGIRAHPFNSQEYLQVVFA